MKRIMEDIGNYMETKELVYSFLLTMLFLVLAFLASTRLTTTQIKVADGYHDVFVSYYGFPFEMIGILTPLTEMEWVWISNSGSGLLRMLWGGLLLDFLLFFLLSFAIIFLIKRLKG